MQCEMCGKEASLKKVLIEGVVMNVCASCAKYGRIIEKPVLKPKKVIKKPRPKNDFFEKEEFVLKDNYGLIIKNKREKLGLKQEDLAKMLSEKLSLIHKIESTSPIIDQKLALKIEKKLNVKITDDPFSKSVPVESDDGRELTFGDLIKKSIKF